MKIKIKLYSPLGPSNIEVDDSIELYVLLSKLHKQTEDKKSNARSHVFYQFSREDKQNPLRQEDLSKTLATLEFKENSELYISATKPKDPLSNLSPPIINKHKELEAKKIFKTGLLPNVLKDLMIKEEYLTSEDYLTLGKLTSKDLTLKNEEYVKQRESLIKILFTPLYQGDHPEEIWETLLEEKQENILRSILEVLEENQEEQQSEFLETTLNKTLLHAAETNNYWLLRWALSYKDKDEDIYIDINTRNSIGQTPLMIAAKNGNIPIAKLLLSMPGIDLDVQDRYSTFLLASARGLEMRTLIEAHLESKENLPNKNKINKRAMKLKLFDPKDEKPLTQSDLNHLSEQLYKLLKTTTPLDVDGGVRLPLGSPEAANQAVKAFNQFFKLSITDEARLPKISADEDGHVYITKMTADKLKEFFPKPDKSCSIM